MATVALTPSLLTFAPGTNQPGTRKAHPKFEQAVEKIQDQVLDEVRWQSEARADGVKLRPNAQSLFLPREQSEAKGTVLLFHGFTAAPWQYEEMASQLHDEGFHVLAKRMPGHGLAEADGKPSHKDIPKTTQGKVWDQFIDQTFADASALGAPVYAVGLSGGGNVALRMAQRNEEVTGVVAAAPFLGGDGLTGVLMPVLNIVDMVTFGMFGRLLDRLPRKERPQVEDDPTPRTQGTWGQALAMYRVGAQVKGIEQPLQVISTEKDLLSGKKSIDKFMNRSSDESGQANGWYHFPAEEKVQHAMLSPKENPNLESVEIVQGIVRDFVVNGQATNRTP